MPTSNIEDLAQRGQAYLTRINSLPKATAYPLHAIAGSKPGEEDNDGRRFEVATRLKRHAQPHPAANWLNKPLWTWNGSLDQPAFRPTGNPLINISECEPLSMVNLAIGVLEHNIPCSPAIRDSMLERIGAVFFGGASPRDLMQEITGSVDFICKDDASPSIWQVSTPLFFELLASKRLVAFDIHDMASHALQLQLWPEFFTRLGMIGARAFRETAQPSSATKLARHLSLLLLYVTFEESLIMQGNQLHSFGCLNWLSPRYTPVATHITAHPTPQQLQLQHRWHSLYALSNLYRNQRLASQDLGQTVNWLERLGYDTDSSFRRLAEQPRPQLLACINKTAANHIAVKAPQSVDELLINATKLLQETNLWTTD